VWLGRKRERNSRVGCQPNMDGMMFPYNHTMSWGGEVVALREGWKKRPIVAQNHNIEGKKANKLVSRYIGRNPAYAQRPR
jgi:hypothetical protein